MSRLTTTERFSSTGSRAASSITSATGMPARWLGMMCAVFSNQKFEIAVRISPLPGIGSAITTSKADRRSEATISMCSSSIAKLSRTLPWWIRGYWVTRLAW